MVPKRICKIDISDIGILFDSKQKTIWSYFDTATKKSWKRKSSRRQNIQIFFWNDNEKYATIGDKAALKEVAWE